MEFSFFIRRGNLEFVVENMAKFLAPSGKTLCASDKEKSLAALGLVP